MVPRNTTLPTVSQKREKQSAIGFGGGRITKEVASRSEAV